MDFIDELYALDGLTEGRAPLEMPKVSPISGKVYDDDELEDDEYTVYDLVSDRLFGFGRNDGFKYNFRQKWKYAEVEPSILTINGEKKRAYFYPTTNQDLLELSDSDRRVYEPEGIGVLLRDPSEAQLAIACAEELNLSYNVKKLTRPAKGFKYEAVIYIPDEIAEMPLEEYVLSIGKSMSDFLRRGSGAKADKAFMNHANYSAKHECDNQGEENKEALDESYGDVTEALKIRFANAIAEVIDAFEEEFNVDLDWIRIERALDLAERIVLN